MLSPVILSVHPRARTARGFIINTISIVHPPQYYIHSRFIRHRFHPQHFSFSPCLPPTRPTLALQDCLKFGKWNQPLRLTACCITLLQSSQLRQQANSSVKSFRLSGDGQKLRTASYSSYKLEPLTHAYPF
jgi:hypothetical protein